MSVSTAIRDVIDKFLINDKIYDFEIFLVCGSKNQKWRINDVVKELKSEKYSVEVKFSENLTKSIKKIGKSSILLFCTNQELQNFLTSKIIYSPFPKLIKLIIYSLELIKLKNVTTIKPLHHHLPINHAFFLNNTKKSIELFTTQLDTKVKCNSRQKVLINNFEKKSQKWTKELKNFEKFRDFHGCMRVFLIEYGVQLYIPGIKFYNYDEINELLSNDTKYVSNTVDIIKILGERANFKPYIQVLHFEFDPKKGEIFRPIYVKEKALYCHEVFYTSSYETYNGNLHVSTNAYYQKEMIFVVTPGEPYTPYEKLLLPFDAQTWTFLIITLVIAFCVIFLINFMPKIIQIVIYGFGVNSPSLNVVAIFFGISQTKLPLSLFGRIILTYFMLFCLVFRHGYQGKFKIV